MDNISGISPTYPDLLTDVSLTPEPWEMDNPAQAAELINLPTKETSPNDEPLAAKEVASSDEPLPAEAATPCVEPIASGEAKDLNEGNHPLVDDQCPTTEMINDKTLPDMSEGSFPAKLFSPTVVKIAEALSQTRLYPIGFTIMSMMFALSVIIGRSRILETVMGEFAANLYILIVGEKGTYKSHPLMWALKPLLRHDSKLNKEYDEEYAAYLRASAADKSNNSIQEPQRPPLYLVNDITPEAIYYALLDNRNGIGLFGDEAFKVLTQGGRYNNKTEYDYLLSLFSGATFCVRRATRRQNLIAENPFFSMIGTIQSSRLFPLFKGEKYDAGLFDRFLLVSEWGYHAKLWNLSGEVTCKDDTEATYQAIITKLEESRPSKYKLSREAALSIESWQNEHERRLEREGTDIQFGAFRKMQIYCMKFALLLQIIWDVDTGNANPGHMVSGINALRATALTDYFYESACGLAEEVIRPVLNAKERALIDAMPNAFTAKDGLVKAQALGIGKTAYYALLGKINGSIIEKQARGTYIKRYIGVTVCANKMKS